MCVHLSILAKFTQTRSKKIYLNKLDLNRAFLLEMLWEMLWENLVGKYCGKILWENLVGKSCGKFLELHADWLCPNHPICKFM